MNKIEWLLCILECATITCSKFKEEATPEHKNWRVKSNAQIKDRNAKYSNRAWHEFPHGNVNIKLIVSLATTSGAPYTLPEYCHTSNFGA